MISWLLTSWPGQALALVAALWFLNGLRKAMFKPSLTYISHQVAKRAGWNGHDGYFVTVERQQLLPPWLLVKETWFVNMAGTRYPSLVEATRESDGHLCQGEGLALRLSALLNLRLAKEKADADAIADLDKQLSEEQRLADVVARAERKRVN